MMKVGKLTAAFLIVTFLSGFTCPPKDYQYRPEKKKKITRVWLIGDSTVADYSLEDGYMSKRYPMTGWGQVFQSFMSSDSLLMVRHLINADSVIVDNRAKGGRSTRSFFEEGRWSEVYRGLQPGDIVLIQFGHNDASVAKGERYTSVTGYKEFLRLYVNQTRQKGAVAVLVTPVARNYPWHDGRLQNTHGEYPAAMRAVADEMNVSLIDLGEMSIDFFSSKGENYSTYTCFMNIDSGVFEAYPQGSRDNTHFQPAGAEAMATLVFDAMKKLILSDIDAGILRGKNPKF